MKFHRIVKIKWIQRKMNWMKINHSYPNCKLKYPILCLWRVVKILWRKYMTIKCLQIHSEFKNLLANLNHRPMRNQLKNLCKIQSKLKDWNHKFLLVNNNLNKLVLITQTSSMIDPRKRNQPLLPWYEVWE